MYQGKLSPFWGTLATCPIVDKLHSCCWNTELTEASAALMWSGNVQTSRFRVMLNFRGAPKE